MHPTSQPKTSRQFWLDAARAIAVISITVNHAVNRSWNIHGGSIAELHQIPWLSTALKIALTIFGHLGVPLFLMISGTLLLKKSLESWTDVKTFYKNNLIPLLITSEVWYVIMYWFILLVKPDNTMLETNGFLGSLPGMFRTMLLYRPTTMRSMWYIPMILSMYAVIPLFAVSLKHSDSAKFLILPCGIIFLTNMLLPDIRDISGLLANTACKRSIPYETYLLYILSGYAISRGAFQRFSSKTVYFGTFSLFLLLCVRQFFAFALDSSYAIGYSASLLLFWSCFAFEAIRRNETRFLRIRQPVSELAKISFGIYFVHIILMEAMNWTMQFNGFPRPIKFLVLEIVSFGGSVILIHFLSKNKHLKRYLFMMKS